MSAQVPHFLGRFQTDAEAAAFVTGGSWFPTSTSSTSPCTSLVAGVMYYNTRNNTIRCYDGSGWVTSGDAFVSSTRQLLDAISDGDTQIVVGASFTLSADATVPESTSLAFTGGAIIGVPAGRTLTINGSVTAGATQIFSGTGTVALSGPAASNVLPEWFGAACDGVTDSTSSIQAALTACASGGSVLFATSDDEYILSASVTVSKAVTLLGVQSTLHWTTGSCAGLVITADDVSIQGLHIIGAQYAVQDIAEWGIKALGADRLRIEQCAVRSWGFECIEVRGSSGLVVADCYVGDAYYGGIILLSVSDAVVSGNRVDNIVGTTITNAYGIALSQIGAEDVCTDVVICNNVIRDVPGWEGIDTHAGQRLTISANTVLHCLRGIVVGQSTAPARAPQDVTITGNVIDSEVTDGSSHEGIVVAGATGGDKAVGLVVTGNVIRNHGDQTNGVSGGGIYARDTRDLIITGNVFYRSSPFGIDLLEENYNFCVSGNVVEDPWTDAVGVGQAVGIYCRNANNYGILSGNNVARGDLVGKAFMLTYSVRQAVGNVVTLTGNHVDAAMVNVMLDYQQIAYAVAITPNANDGSVVKVGTLTGDITINAPTEASLGQHLTFIFTQDGAGAHAINFNAVFLTSWVPGVVGGDINTISFVYDGTNWVQTSASVGL